MFAYDPTLPSPTKFDRHSAVPGEAPQKYDIVIPLSTSAQFPTLQAHLITIEPEGGRTLMSANHR